MKKLVLIFTAAAVLLLSVGAVSAQETPAAPVPTTEVGRANPIRTVLAIIADETDLGERAIIRQFAAGTSLVSLIEDNNGDVQTVIDQSVEQITVQVNEALANGTITQERADRVLANLRDVITEAINGELFPNRPNRGEGQRAAAVLRLAADETGLTVRDILGEIRSGKSLADVLTANNVDVEAFIDTAVAAAKTRLDRAVTNGRVTQADADTRLEQFEQRLSERIYQVGAMEETPEATSEA